MTNLPIKITQISKDFNIKSKDVLDTFKELGIEKKSGGSADKDEFELFISALTEKHQIKDLDAYRNGRTKIKSAEEKKEKAPKKKGKAGLVVILVLEIIVLLGLVGWWIQWLL